jgi:hypothetical protein
MAGYADADAMPHMLFLPRAILTYPPSAADQNGDHEFFTCTGNGMVWVRRADGEQHSVLTTQ